MSSDTTNDENTLKKETAEVSNEYEEYADEYDYEFNPKKININEIIDDINSKIVGQEDAVNTLVTSIYYNQLLIDELTTDLLKEYNMSLVRKIKI